MTWQAGLYVAATLIPLAAFVVELLGGRRLGKSTALVATGAVGLSFVLSLVGFLDYFLVEARGQVFVGQAEVARAEAAAESGQPVPTMPPRPVAWTARVPWVAIGGEATPGRVVPQLEIPLGIRVDNLTVLMFLMVTFIATLVHVYSIAYMHDDPRYPLFFAYLSLFCFAMLGLLAADNLFLVFVAWELVGLCSYLLIGYWRDETPNVEAANKAFIVNRIGDVGMLVGLGLLWSSLGTLDIEEINRGVRGANGQWNASGANILMKDQDTGAVIMDAVDGAPRAIPAWLLTVAGLGIFAGCAGKSAQFPLHVWLPDAMAGPTPVSALIHAATMVAAGVYLVGRFFPVFTDPVLLTIAYAGGITLFIAATTAMVQTDYKKVLAYSTVSQLGFMMLGLGVGGRAAGLFHLMTHASFKALMFLGAGSVYHAVHTYEMPALGGLYRRMKGTALAMLVGTLAISGVPLLSGFYSKDAILASALHFVFERHHYGHILLFLLPAAGATLTAFYMLRMWLLMFGGEPRGDLAGHAHDPGPLMLWPLYVLAVPSIAAGWTWIVVPFFGFQPVLEQMVEYGEPIVAHDVESWHLWAMGASVIVAGLGGVLGVFSYSPWERWKRLDPARTAARFAPVHNLFIHKWYFDELYDAVLVRPTLKLARWVSLFDQHVLDRLVDGTAWATARLSRLGGLVDVRLVDGLVNGVADLVYGAGDLGRRLQTGRVRNYLMVLAVALLGLFAGVFAWVLG